jgi:hypothetical protein
MPINSNCFPRLEHVARTSLVVLFLVQNLLLSEIFYVSAPALAAEDLSLRPGLSFNQDIDNGFPIVGKDMDATTPDQSRSTFIFFGASGDLNTNRQAKRVVEFYHKINAKALNFIIIDVDHPPNDGAKTLIKNYYKGYIPAQVLLDKAGKVVWNQTGEVDLSNLKAKLDKTE